ncbi:hypothetical protein BHE74_00012090 [Ensete ventricosum]|nr:hypothetical protein GW17_00009416 [Ensete ventricosum]RWW79606.1 hypothetical protein BHE74_00012090 [Ensete ventricosum]
MTTINKNNRRKAPTAEDNLIASFSPRSTRFFLGCSKVRPIIKSMRVLLVEASVLLGAVSALPVPAQSFPVAIAVQEVQRRSTLSVVIRQARLAALFLVDKYLSRKSENAMTAGRNDITTQKNRTTANRARTRAVIVSFTIEAGELEFDSLTNGTNPGSTASRSYFPPTARLALSSASVKLLIKQTSTLLSFDSRF